MNVIVENIPAEIRATPHWVAWKLVRKPGEKKPRKLPMQCNSADPAASDDPRTWSTFDNAVQCAAARGYEGVAFMLSDADPFTMYDLDDCIDDSGAISADAQAIISRFATYSEISPSGDGVKGIARGKFVGKGKNVAGLGECYCRARMFCFTGNKLPDAIATIEPNQDAIDWWYAKLTGAKQKTNPSTSADVSGFDQDKLAARAWNYIAKMPDAISGSGGHNATFHAFCVAFRFGLDKEHAQEVAQRFNEEKTGGELWSNEELQHKLDDALKEVTNAGELGSMARDKLADKSNPRATAARLLKDLFDHPDHSRLVFTSGDFYDFTGTNHEQLEDAALRQAIDGYLAGLEISIQRGDSVEVQPYKPNTRDKNEVTDSLRSLTYQNIKPPAWIGAGPAVNPSELIVAPNGLFTLKNQSLVKVCDPTPRFFTTNALDYDLLADAAPPHNWLAFLDDIFDGDTQQIELLQEWFGYCLTTDTAQQKALMIVGPPRSGKGTIARVISRMIGLSNVCAPTLAGLSMNFGMSPLLGKMLAIISDARLSGRTDAAIVTERILTMTGEDAVTIDRKNRDQITTRLLVRLMLLTNELPRLADASGALANRFLILMLRKSYLGAEDIGLTDRLVSELPNIAAWSIAGLIRLRDEGRFTCPAASDAVRQELDDLASPISTFIRDWCRVAPGASCPVADLFAAWRIWCDEQGRREHGNVATFGRDVRAAVPGVTVRQPRQGEKRVREYEGVGLTLQAQATVDIERAKKEQADERREHSHAY